MLNKPFQLIHKIDFNRYYVVEFDRYNRFIATETIFYLKNNPNSKAKEKTQGLKMLRLSAPILGLLIGYSQLPVSEEINKGIEAEKLYKRLDVDFIKAWINDLIGTQGDLKDGQYEGISTPDTYENPTVQALIQEGYEILSVIQEGSRTDTVLLIKQNPLGIFRVAELVLTGKETGKTLVSMTTHTLNKDIATKIIEKLDNFRTKKTNTQIEKEIEKEN
jgi:hypothetical protein